jgi:hypothetical protein
MIKFKKSSAMLMASALMVSTVVPAFAETTTASTTTAAQYIASLCITIVANVVGHCICTWLDKK